MRFLLTLLPFLTLVAGGAPLPTFTTHVESAFTTMRAGDPSGAAAALDAAAREDPALFAANNLNYLRGRLAENRADWPEAQRQFAAVAQGNPLRALAAWREARIAARLSDGEALPARIAELPANFPANLKMQIAAEAPMELALTVYRGLALREARLKQALILKDSAALWKLLRERNSDDVALEAARQLAAGMGEHPKPEDAFDLAEAFLASRQFDDAVRFYGMSPAAKAAAARFQIARVQFLRDDCAAAIPSFEAIARDLPGTSWAHDAEAQVANCFWRLNDFQRSEKAYVAYIARYGGPAREENAVRNLVDVYRVLGDNAKAIALIDRSLALTLTAATRQVLLFSKAKILFIEKKYTAAAPLFRQLARAARMEIAAGAATRDEARYYEALSLLKGGDAAGAHTLFKALTADPRAYYGQKAAARLGTPSNVERDPSFCVGDDAIALRAEAHIAALARPIRTEPAPFASAAAELIFLRLWDDASVAAGLEARPDARIAALLAYLAGRYDRAIQYGSRLPKNDALARPLTYPAGFRALICGAAQKTGTDPQWIHAVIWVESKYDPLAKSGAAARGLMQFIPATANTVARAAGVALDSMDRLYDPAISIQLGAQYWASLMAEFKAPELALAAYNGGPENVRRWKAKWPDGETEFVVSDIGFTETKAYVLAVFAARAEYAEQAP